MSLTQNVLITGAAGFVGSHLTQACLAAGYRVTALDSLTDYYDPAMKRSNVDLYRDHPSCTFVHADLLTANLDSVLAGTDVVFHLAAQPGVRGSWGDRFRVYSRENIDAFQRLLEIASRHRLEKFVYASSSSVYGNAEAYPTPESLTPAPVSPYGMTKVASEQLAAVYHRNHGLPIVGLRYFTVYGPRQRPDMAFNRLITAALAGEVFTVFGDGSQTRDFTFVSDIVDGTIGAALAGTPGAVYNLGGGSRVSMHDIFTIARTHMSTALQLDFVDRQRGDAKDTSADISRAKADFGYEPAVPVADGLAAQITWHREQLAPGGRVASSGSPEHRRAVAEPSGQDRR